MKILYTITQAFDPNAAGVQRTTYRLGKYFSDCGLDVAYFSGKKDGHADIKYGKLFAVNYDGGLKERKNVEFLINLLKSWQPDIVINQLPYDVVLRDLLLEHKNIYGYKLFGCLHNSLFSFINNLRHKTEQKLSRNTFKLIDNKIGLYAIKLFHEVKHRRDLYAILNAHDRYILLTPQNRDELSYFIGDYNLDKTIVIPNSIPETKIDSINSKKKVILSVGRLDVTQKRADLLIEFWKAAYKLLPEWNFIIVGDGPYKRMMEQEIFKCKLPRISMEGYQKPEKYYQIASIFIMTSAYEGFPNTILEANSYACPVIAFRSYKAIDWIVKDGENACLSEPYDINDMVEKTIKIINDPDKLKAMQFSALNNAERFTIDKVGPQWLSLFNEN